MKWLFRKLGFHMHEWGPWKTKLEYYWVYSKIIQARECKTCGKKNMRYQIL